MPRVAAYAKPASGSTRRLAPATPTATAPPNTAMLRELQQAGVRIYLCSQSATFKKFGYDEFNPAVTIAVSAMTAHVRLQQEGYTLIPF